MIDILPSEILLRIFSYLAADKPAQDLSIKDGRTHSRTNFAFSHVCRWWRRLALDEPRLWTRIIFIPCMEDGTEAADTMIQRARNLPLHVEVPEIWSNDLLARLGPSNKTFTSIIHLHRIETLDITVRRWMNYSKRWAVAPGTTYCSAPALRTLRVHGTSHYLDWMPSDFLAEGAPLLQALDIVHLSRHWQWDHPIFSHLTSLKVHALGGISHRLERETSDLLGALQRSPDLEILVLRGVIPVLVTAGHTTVLLHCLRELQLLGSMRRLSALLERLSFPLNCKCSFNTIVPEHDWHRSWDGLHRFDGQLEKISLRVKSNTQHMHGWIGNHITSNQEPILELRTRCNIPSLDTEGEQYSLLCHMYTPNVKQLDLNWSWTNSRILFRTITRALPDLETLTVRGGRNCMAVLRALSLSLRANTHPSDSDTIIMPQLRDLDLVDLHLWSHPSAREIEM
jgi:hypothetical protein